MVETRSNMQLADLNSNPHGEKILRDLIDFTTGPHLYYPSGSEHYRLFRIDKFYETSRINNNHENNNETKFSII